METKKLTLLDRVTLRTPRFFRKVRTVSAAVGAVGAVLVASPALLPAGLVALGGYLVLAGSIGAAVASVAVEPGPRRWRLKSGGSWAGRREKRYRELRDWVEMKQPRPVRSGLFSLLAHDMTE